MSNPKTGIFIPCYNVEKSICKVLDSFSSEVLSFVDTILLINNCSTDNTLDVVNNYLNTRSEISKKIVIVSNHENYGLGGSQKIAFNYFIKNSFDYLMIVHGDNQCDANIISSRFIDLIKSNNPPEFILSSRFAMGADTSSYNFLRRVGNRFFNYLTTILTGAKISDAGAGVVCLKVDSIKSVNFKSLDNFFHFNPQLNVLLFSQPKIKICEVPIMWRDSESDSNINGLVYSLKLTILLVRYRINLSLLKKKDDFFSNNDEFNPRYSLLNTKPDEAKTIS